MVSETTIRPHARRCTNASELRHLQLRFAFGSTHAKLFVQRHAHARSPLPLTHVRATVRLGSVREVQNVMPTVIGTNCSDRTSPPLASPPPTSVP